MTTAPISVSSVSAEQSVIGALMLDNGAWDRLDGALAPNDFYRHDHRLIFGAMSRLFNEGKPVDVLTVLDSLSSAGEVNEAGGLEYLNSIATSVPSSANVKRYAEIVHAHRVRRDVQALGNEISAMAAEGMDPAELVEKVTSMAMALADQRQAGRDPQPIGELLTDVLNALESRVDQKGGVSGISTGFADMDQKTSGLQSGDLIIIAGRPSMGKTTFAVNIAENVAVAGGVSLVISLEMSAAQLAERTVARFGEIDTQRMRTGRLSQDDYTKLTGALGRLQDQRLIIADDPSLSSASRIRLAARKIKQRQGRLDLIVIDYLQLMAGDGSNRNEELGGITRALKLVAREIGCPIILLSQLSRKVEERLNKRPIMSDLRESGAIEQDADVILMAYRDDYYNEDSPLKGYAEILIRKQRMGPLGEVTLVFEGQHSRFLDADPHSLAAARNLAASQPKKKFSMLRD
ncbi:replicative DNA helicase [Bordetella genomosp. 4]|uniref:Replicative DNA helicase n=1 Tax=Bordetella genomosp. 4 TaxID=463044 RepID=A0A261U563_9BORD|nr:replicative DNA helicase [Bordetella genomosp. 4]OZI56755.1 replicative DNA helicase [Bordetella genomosp. 4]